MMSLSPVVNHMPGTLSFHPPMPPPLTDANFSSVSGWVAVVKGHPRYNHVAVREVGVEAVTFLQNSYHDPHMAINRVNTEIGKRRRPPLADLYWAPYGPLLSR